MVMGLIIRFTSYHTFKSRLNYQFSLDVVICPTVYSLFSIFLYLCNPFGRKHLLSCLLILLGTWCKMFGQALVDKCFEDKYCMLLYHYLAFHNTHADSQLEGQTTLKLLNLTKLFIQNIFMNVKSRLTYWACINDFMKFSLDVCTLKKLFIESKNFQLGQSKFFTSPILPRAPKDWTYRCNDSEVVYLCRLM